MRQSSLKLSLAKDGEFMPKNLNFIYEHYFSSAQGLIIYVMLYAIWYDLYNLKNAKNTYGGAFILKKLQARFLNCTNGTKSRKASHIFKRVLNTLLN